MSDDLIALLAVSGLLLAALFVGLLAYLTAHRLDRLHIRTDLARRSLEGVVERRHTVAATVARELERGELGSGAAVLSALTEARAHPSHAVLVVDPAPDPDRARWTVVDEPRAEHAENALGIALATIDPARLPAEVHSELDDVTDRLSMARRFYNDAVRDTRALRERRWIRWLRLAGRAPMPDYVELVDQPVSEHAAGRPGGGPSPV